MAFNGPSTFIMSLGFLVTFILIGFGVYHGLLLQQRKKTASSILEATAKWQRIATILAFLSLTFYILQTLSIATQPFEFARDDFSCDLWEFFATLFYHWSKGYRI